MAGYGSPKDVAVYAALGLSPSQTYIVGRAVRKLQAQCQVRPKGRLGTELQGQGQGPPSVLSAAREGRCRPQNYYFSWDRGNKLYLL